MLNHYEEYNIVIREIGGSPGMKVAAIIPAYNEEATIGSILDIVKESKLVGNIIVVSDGSTDMTAKIARDRNVTVVELEKNIGKGGAMIKGLEKSDADILLFLDADLIGLTTDHIEYLLTPVLDGEVAMTVGVFSRGRIATNLAQKIAPYLSGQRAIKREILENISYLSLTRFGVEIALTNYVEETGIEVKEVILKDMTHVMKEEKLGLLRGFAARMKMYWEIAKYVRKG